MSFIYSNFKVKIQFSEDHAKLNISRYKISLQSYKRVFIFFFKCPDVYLVYILFGIFMHMTEIIYFNQT